MRVRRSMLAVVVLSSMALLTAAFATIVLAQPGNVSRHNQSQQPNVHKEASVQHISGWTPSSKRVGANSDVGAQGAVAIMTEDFEGTFPGAGWSLSGTPNHWGTSTCEQHAGMQSAWVEGTSGLACGSDYETSEESRIIYGPFSLGDAAAARLSFSYWLSSEEYYDYLYWGSSINGTDFWGYGVSGNSGGWLDETFDITTTHMSQPNVWIAFLWKSDSSIVNSEGAFVDDLVLTKDLSETNIVGQKTASRATAVGGDVVTYTISVRNNATIDAAAVHLTDTLPTNLSLVNGSLTASAGGLGIQGQVITWAGAINSSQTVLITYAARLANAIPVGTLVTNPLAIDNGAGAVFNTRATVKVGSFVFLPLVMRRWPPIPYTPVLNPIANAGGGSYTVSWSESPEQLADTYTLQEATDPSFSNPTTAYSGSGTSWSASSKATGTYYYRVKGHNIYGDSGWSNIQSVQVVPPATIVYVQNDTGGQLCYEVYGSGIGNRCYSSSGQSLYGTFPSGTYSWHASARCGSANGTRYYSPGPQAHQFSCR